MDRSEKDVIAEIKAQLEAGKMTAEQAEQRLQRLKQRRSSEMGQYDRQERYAKATAEIKMAVDKGKMTAEPGRRAFGQDEGKAVGRRKADVPGNPGKRSCANISPRPPPRSRWPWTRDG